MGGCSSEDATKERDRSVQTSLRPVIIPKANHQPKHHHHHHPDDPESSTSQLVHNKISTPREEEVKEVQWKRSRRARTTSYRTLSSNGTDAAKQRNKTNTVKHHTISLHSVPTTQKASHKDEPQRTEQNKDQRNNKSRRGKKGVSRPSTAERTSSPMPVSHSTVTTTKFPNHATREQPARPFSPTTNEASSTRWAGHKKPTRESPPISTQQRAFSPFMTSFQQSGPDTQKSPRGPPPTSSNRVDIKPNQLNIKEPSPLKLIHVQPITSSPRYGSNPNPIRNAATSPRPGTVADRIGFFQGNATSNTTPTMFSLREPSVFGSSSKPEPCRSPSPRHHTLSNNRPPSSPDSNAKTNTQASSSAYAKALGGGSSFSNRRDTTIFAPSLLHDLNTHHVVKQETQTKPTVSPPIEPKPKPKSSQGTKPPSTESKPTATARKSHEYESKPKRIKPKLHRKTTTSSSSSNQETSTKPSVTRSEPKVARTKQETTIAARPASPKSDERILKPATTPIATRSPVVSNVRKTDHPESQVKDKVLNLAQVDDDDDLDGDHDYQPIDLSHLEDGFPKQTKSLLRQGNLTARGQGGLPSPESGRTRLRRSSTVQFRERLHSSDDDEEAAGGFMAAARTASLEAAATPTDGHLFSPYGDSVAEDVNTGGVRAIARR